MACPRPFLFPDLNRNVRIAQRPGVAPNTIIVFKTTSNLRIETQTLID
jgi:hypothetical protein